MMDFAPPEPSKRDQLLILRKRLRDEMEALRGILRKAELLASSKTVVGKASRPAPRCGKDGRFFVAEDRSDPTEAEKITSAKRRKTMHEPTVEIVEPRMSARTTSAERRTTMHVPTPSSNTVCKSSHPAPRRGKDDGRFLVAGDRSDPTKAEKTTSLKRKTTPTVEIVQPRMSERTTSTRERKTMPAMATVEIVVEPRMSKDEIASVATRVSALASDMPARILEFLKKECTGHLDEDAGEIQIDLGSMRRSAMSELQRLLDEFAEEEKRRHQNAPSMNVSTPISCLSPCKPEEGEIVEEDCDAIVDVCGDTSPAAAAKVLCPPPRTLEDGEIAEEEEEEAVGCAAAAAVVSEKKIVEAGDSTSSSSSSSGSSSSSDSSDSDSDDDSVTSSPAPAVVPKADASAVATAHNVLRSSPCLPEAIECNRAEEGVRCGDVAPVGTEKIAETVNNSPSSSSSSSSSGSSSCSSSSSSGSSSCCDSSDSDDDGETVTSRPAPAVVPTADASAVAAPAHKAPISSPPRSLEDGKKEAAKECDATSHVPADKLAQTGKIPRGNISSSSSLLEDGEIEEKQEGNGASPVTLTTQKSERVGSLPAARVVCAKPPLQQYRSAAPDLVARGNGKKRMLPCSQKRKRSPARVSAEPPSKEKTKSATSDAIAKAKEKMRSLERQRFHKMLEEKERNAKPIFDDWMDPVHLRQLGITPPVEYALTSERCVPGRGCPVQKLLGLFLKP